MNELTLAPVESKFADIIWRSEPIASGELAKLCQKELTWKRTTTYNVLRKLCNRGIFKNENGIVTSQISKEDFYAAKGEIIVKEAFGGSLPTFISAFTKRVPLTSDEIAEIRKFIDSVEED